MKRLFLFTLFLITLNFMVAEESVSSAQPESNTNTENPSNVNESKPAQNFEETVYNFSRTFAEVLQLANNKHYKIDDPQESMIKAIDSFLTRLDPHSSFLDPKTYKSVLESTSGEFFGIGIVIDNTRNAQDKFLTVVDTIPGGPADIVGLKPIDKILEVDGKPLEGMTTEEATAALKGKKDTKVNVKVMREGEKDLLEFDITRDVIKEQNSLSFHLPEQNIYYLSLNMFTQNVIKQIEELIKKSTEQQYKGLIVDLRNNSGGLLNSVIDISGLFLDKGSLVVTTKDKHNNETGRYETSREPIANTELPIFILTNNYTASAAEILAGCLKLHSQDYAKKAGKKRQDKMMVFLVGTNTFGKGSVQEVIPISNNCAAKITTSLYFLPFDTSIQGKGIEPDFVIEKNFPPTKQMEWFQKYYGQEKLLAHSIKTAPEKKEEKTKEVKPNKTKTWAQRAKKMLKTDNQLRETITLINMLDTAKQFAPQQVKNRNDAVVFLNTQHVTNKKLKMVEVKI